jgi:hypothetical protein
LSYEIEKQTSSSPSSPSIARTCFASAPSGKDTTRLSAWVKAELWNDRTRVNIESRRRWIRNSFICVAAKTTPAVTASAFTKFAIVDRSIECPEYYESTNEKKISYGYRERASNVMNCFDHGKRGHATIHQRYGHRRWVGASIREEILR